MARMSYASFSEPTQYTVQSLYGSMQRPYSLVLLPHPSYDAAVMLPPYMRNAILSPPYGTSIEPPSSPPYHRYPQYPAYGSSMHYSLPALPCQPFMALVAPRQASIPDWYHHANIPPWQNRAYVPSWQHRANIPPGTHRYNMPPRQHRVNIPPRTHRYNMPPRQNRAIIASRQHQTNITPEQYQVNMQVLEGDQYDNPTPLFGADEVQPYPFGDVGADADEVQPYPFGDVGADADEVQPQPSNDAEAVAHVLQPQMVPEDDEFLIGYQLPEEIGTEDMTRNGGTPATNHATESLPSVVLSLRAETADCVICMDDMCAQDEDEITKLPCGHLFHRDCIALWLCDHNTCPLCRFELPVDASTSG